MSETPQLTVPTAFNDISQLAEGMSDRVDEERLMLYGPGPVDDNSWIRFSVLLMDQSVALAGVGRAVASIDGGEERPEVARFDIVLDNLQFEGTSEVVYERMLVYRSQAFAEGPGTGEVSREEVDAAEAALAEDAGDAGDAHAVAGEADVEELPEDSTMVASADEYAEHVQATADEDAPAEVAADDVQDLGLSDFSEDEHEIATVVGDAPSEAEVAAAAGDAVDQPPEAYEEAEPTAVSFDEVDEVAAADGGDYTPPSTEAESFAEVHTEDIEGPGDAWGTDEVDVSEVDEIEVSAADAPPSAPPPAPPEAPPGFSIEAAPGALSRPSRGATWTPNLALAPEPRAPSGLFPYAGGLPVPERAPRPDLDPSYHIQPAPRPVEASGDQTDLEGDAGDVQSYDDVQEIADISELEASPDDAPSSDEAQEIGAVDTGGLDYEQDYGEPDGAASFDDASTEVVPDDDEPAAGFAEPAPEGFEDADATRMDLEAPEEPT